MKRFFGSLTILEAVTIMLVLWAIYWLLGSLWRWLTGPILLFALCGLALAAPQDAVVRISSHGCSGTVIATTNGRTTVLTCAHAFKSSNERTRRIVIDAPAPVRGAVITTALPKLVSLDYSRDLALIQMQVGPLPYVCPVAPAGSRRPVNCVAVGYGDMRLPALVKYMTVRSVYSDVTYTTERPMEGMSGGPLVGDGYLVGVVGGYELVPPYRGIYVSHPAILAFLRPISQPMERFDPGPAVSTRPVPYATPTPWTPRPPSNC